MNDWPQVAFDQHHSSAPGPDPGLASNTIATNAQVPQQSAVSGYAFRPLADLGGTGHSHAGFSQGPPYLNLGPVPPDDMYFMQSAAADPSLSGRSDHHWPPRKKTPHYRVKVATSSTSSLNAPPTILPASELKPELDLVGAALSRNGPAAEEVASLAGAKSGLRVGFVTNSQPGVQFYTNMILSVPEKSAQTRKKIHSASKAVGDGYAPGTAAFLEFHTPLAAWILPQTRGLTGDDTLLASERLGPE
ncbi:hypothetical protein BV20DRAFT_1056195 [Pilatotrama ljubarskyi]|nr:hypothetical protein BV20DRAFT_1056195 [Pilatotrama ljubarskyi]